MVKVPANGTRRIGRGAEPPVARKVAGVTSPSSAGTRRRSSPTGRWPQPPPCSSQSSRISRKVSAKGLHLAPGTCTLRGTCTVAPGTVAPGTLALGPLAPWHPAPVPVLSPSRIRRRPRRHRPRLLVGRPLRCRRRVLLQLLHHHRDRPLELRIAAGDHVGRASAPLRYPAARLRSRPPSRRPRSRSRGSAR